MNNIEPQLLNVQKAAAFLGVNPGTIRRWAKAHMLSGIKVGSRGDWRFKEADLTKLTSIPGVKREQRKFAKIQQLLKDNADEIQKLATEHHAKLIGSNPLPKTHFEKYSKVHIKIIKAISNNLDDFQKGSDVFKEIGEELARESVKDGLTIEEAVDGTIFLKQAIWKKLEATGMLKELSTQDFYEFGQKIGNYCDVLASKIAFTYHNHLTEKIAKNEARFRALTEKSSDAIALVNTKGKVIYASPATQVLMGYTPEEFKKLTNPFELVPPDDRKFVTKLFEKLITKPGTTEYAIYRVLHKNGHHIWIESAMTNLLNDPNVGAIVINYRDITERKGTLEKLKISEERQRLALKAGLIGVWDWDVINNKIEWTDEVYAIHGVEKRKFEGKLEAYQQTIYPDDINRVNEAIENALKGQNPYDIEFRIITPRKMVKWIHTSATITYNTQGKPVRMLGATTDITVRKQLERQKDDFIGVAAHELKTPVTSIKGYAQVLQSRFGKEGNIKAVEMLSKMDSQLKKLTSLIGDLLDVTKVEAGKMQFHEGYFDGNELISEIVDEMQLTTTKHSIVKKLTVTRTMYGDKDRIGQVITNLISNAIKYSPHDKEIIVSTSIKNDELTVCVKDFGFGIPKEQQDKVFDRFFRVAGKQQETFAGLGLGLFIASEIIKRHNGRIWLESIECKGSTFCFMLPIKSKISNKKNN